MQHKNYAWKFSDFLEIFPGGRTAVYEEIKSGRLKARKLGRSTIVTEADYLAYLEALPEWSPANVGANQRVTGGGA